MSRQQDCLRSVKETVTSIYLQRLTATKVIPAQVLPMQRVILSYLLFLIAIMIPLQNSRLKLMKRATAGKSCICIEDDFNNTLKCTLATKIQSLKGRCIFVNVLTSTNNYPLNIGINIWLLKHRCWHNKVFHLLLLTNRLLNCPTASTTSFAPSWI